MTRPTLSRRAFLQACGAGGAALALPSLLGACGTDPGVTIPGGDPLPMPPLDDGELVAGVRVFRLDLQAGTVDFGAGAPTATYGINGAYLGPTLRFRRGERVRLEVTNSLAEPSTLHWHGMHVPAASDGGPYVMVAPGATWVTEYEVTQRPMTAWYHPHPMHQTARQVYMGLAGVIYVDEPTPPADLPSTYGVDDLPLVIQDRRFFADGTHPYSGGATVAMHDMMAGLKGQTMLVNGAVQPRGVIARGLVRLRLLNGSNARTYHLGFADGRSFQLIASDGGLLAAPVTTARVLLAPGERASCWSTSRPTRPAPRWRCRASRARCSARCSPGRWGRTWPTRSIARPSTWRPSRSARRCRRRSCRRPRSRRSSGWPRLTPRAPAR